MGYEMGKRDRQDLYKNDGLISVTSRILNVVMLQSDIPTEFVTGMIILHAEKVTPHSLKACIVRLYREKNKVGLLKAFSDQPERITSGMSPLKHIMKELQLRRVHIYAWWVTSFLFDVHTVHLLVFSSLSFSYVFGSRFHEDVKNMLEICKADVIEFYQHLTEPMEAIHHAIV
ncbi:hypothetical protein BD769DRAFT_1665665 [Suillus cothurnatus]|nr:hypothetical protein BD769DRAFT_1665665 [Suillus cothurnatus]